MDRTSGALLPFTVVVVGLSLLLLLIAFRSWTIPLKATAGFLLSVGAAFGAMVAAFGDEARLQQVLRNLVGNAVQHNPSGTRVRLALHRDGGEARVDVTDNGSGIPAADIPRLFDRFWRAEASRSRAYGGSGLGLAIVQAIVRAHGGRVAVDSEVGHGTTVSLCLPTAERVGAPLTGGPR
ncbi:sensor histidine kinase [Streptomyces radicis]|uniref:sensor histidine kinase n=1 Tax=Streptomyces radicis TaxID=1750517 RepID=UPI001E3715F2|nr:ATP-binding protein [Streptomyces radicis]